MLTENCKKLMGMKTAIIIPATNNPLGDRMNLVYFQFIMD